MFNPCAETLINELQIPLNYYALAANSADWAVDLVLKQLQEDPNFKFTQFIYRNTNPRIIAYVLAHREFINYQIWSTNPAAINVLRDHVENIHTSVYSNPAIFEPTLSQDLIETLMTL